VSTDTAKLIASYEALPEGEKQEFVKELFRRLPRFDSGPLDDDEVVRAGDQLAASLDEEEDDATAR
jgi:hypothetical protein